MILGVVEAVLASSEPPAGVDMCISSSEKHSLGASVPSPTRASSLHIGRAEGSVLLSLPNLVWRIGSRSTFAEEVSTRFTRFSAVPSVRLLVFMYVSTSAPVARRDC